MRRLSLGTGLGLLVLSLAYLVQGRGLSLGTPEQPGPGLFPILIGLLLAGASLAFCLQVVRRPAEAPGAAPLPAGSGSRLGSVVAALVGFCLALPWIGYGVAAFGLLAVILRLFGVGRWSAAAALALLATGASHLLFALVLGVPLPAGPWGF